MVSAGRVQFLPQWRSATATTVLIPARRTSAGEFRCAERGGFPDPRGYNPKRNTVMWTGTGESAASLQFARDYRGSTKPTTSSFSNTS